MASAPSSPARARVHARVEGKVQGVGFRPHVFRLASELALVGSVRNDERGVVVEVEGSRADVELFFERLATEAPPLALVEGVTREVAEPRGEEAFSIGGSERSGEPSALVLADAATCEECLAEVLDPDDRRHRYPFTNCTNCGPRFTIVTGVPYDRPLTTMAGFEMCAACRAEYEDPGDRRFHAQPNACPECGPRVRLVDADGRGLDGGADAVARAAEALRSGLVVAVKGLGGYHLACDARSEQAVSDLRERKRREEKPLALMVGDVDAAHELVTLSERDVELLLGRERPIVIAPRRVREGPQAGAPAGEVAERVAPRSASLGVMLPYSPLHHLLLADFDGPLVMTSGNVSDEPIAYEDSDALERLRGIADVFLVHDRPVHMRADDSVVRSVGVGRSGSIVMRRSRGYAPASVELPVDCEAHVLASGAEQKSTFCVAKGRRAWVGHHIGDLENWETLRSFRDGVDHFERLFAVEPAVVAHDLHPDYLSTEYALDRDGVETVGVQHHHAHLAACLAEHGERGPAVGAIFDGTGYGTDGSVWGGEILAGDLVEFERAGHLWPVRLPGGAAAVREVWRMACAWLVESGGGEAVAPRLASVVEPERWRQVAEFARTGFQAPVTTSMGRLFDAVAALVAVRATASYEGQAAVELEAAADAEGVADRAYAMPLAERDGMVLLDARATVLEAARDALAGERAGVVGARFHAAVAAATVSACERVASARGLDLCVLSGGVFQNRLLLRLVHDGLVERGLRVLVPELLPPNDGGISYGQVAVAAARMAAGGGPSSGSDA